MKFHPHDLLREAAAREAKGEQKVLDHLAQCARCQERFAFLVSKGLFRHSSTESADYGPAIERSFQTLGVRQALLERERAEAPGVLSRLIALIPEKRQLLLRNSRRFQSWGLFELLIQRGKEETFIAPRHAEQLLHLAIEISTHLDPSFYGKARIEDMRARTYGYIANARRARMDLHGAEEAFQEAFLRLRKGTEDFLERAVLLDLKASLRRAQRDYEESLRLSSRAIASFSKAGNNHWVGRAFVNASVAYSYRGDTEQAISLLHRALKLIDRVQEPRLALCALNNLADNLAACGRFLSARRVLVQARPLYQRFREPQVQNRSRWLEAKVAIGLGRYREAEALLVAARDGFISMDAAYDGDLVSRDLASIRAGVRGGA